jgi:hypothetical protein
VVSLSQQALALGRNLLTKASLANDASTGSQTICVGIGSPPNHSYESSEGAGSVKFHKTSKALAVADVQARLRQVGALPAGGTPDDAARFHHAEFERWGAVVRATGAKAE